MNALSQSVNTLHFVFLCYRNADGWSALSVNTSFNIILVCFVFCFFYIASQNWIISLWQCLLFHVPLCMRCVSTHVPEWMCEGCEFVQVQESQQVLYFHTPPPPLHSSLQPTLTCVCLWVCTCGAWSVCLFISQSISSVWNIVKDVET